MNCHAGGAAFLDQIESCSVAEVLNAHQQIADASLFANPLKLEPYRARVFIQFVSTKK